MRRHLLPPEVDEVPRKTCLHDILDGLLEHRQPVLHEPNVVLEDEHSLVLILNDVLPDAMVAKETSDLALLHRPLVEGVLVLRNELQLGELGHWQRLSVHGLEDVEVDAEEAED